VLNLTNTLLCVSKHSKAGHVIGLSLILALILTLCSTFYSPTLL